MDERDERSALLSALTTEHFVLQTANNSTYSEASARSTLYVMALSSSLVAIGFVAGSTDLLIPFAAIVLPVVFLLGIFTVMRLAAQPGSPRPGPGDEVMAGQVLSLKGCFLARLRTHTCGQNRRLRGVALSGPSAVLSTLADDRPRSSSPLGSWRPGRSQASSRVRRSPRAATTPTMAIAQTTAGPEGASKRADATSPSA